MSTISKVAAANIADHKAASRKAVLDDLSLVVESRRGEVTLEQLEIVASILSYVVGAADLPRALVGWQANCRVSAEIARPFWDSAAWGNVLARAQAAELGEVRGYRPDGEEARQVDPRKDWSIPAIRDAFDISDAVSAILHLTTLVSEKRRSALRRAAEGVGPGKIGRPAREDRPWEAEGISQRTWQRRQKGAKEAAHAALVDGVAAVSRNSTISIKKEKEGSPLDTVEFRDTLPPGLIFYDRLESPWPPVVPRVPEPPRAGLPEWMQATAEARRLNALAKRLGMVLSDYAEPRHLRGWWKAPAERELTADEEAEWCGALDDADRGEARREAVALARAKEAAKTAGPPTPRVPRDPYACPARVSPDVWDAVPRDLRPATALYAGGHHFYGAPPDEAVLRGAEQAKRVAAIIAAVAALAPESDPARVKALADKRWGGATREVASSIVETMAAEDAQYVVDREKAEAAIATIIERKEVYVPAAARRREARDNAITAVSVVVNGDSSTIRTEDRQRVIIVAAGIMQADETLTPEEAVEKSVWHWFHLARR